MHALEGLPPPTWRDAMRTAWGFVDLADEGYPTKSSLRAAGKCFREALDLLVLAVHRGEVSREDAEEIIGYTLRRARRRGVRNLDPTLGGAYAGRS